tara:strand:+ start:283 stop:639 length:357 start_codon:yes stop_codon:yes gene_type:complete
MFVVAWCLAALALAWGLSWLLRADARDFEPPQSAPMGEADVTPDPDEDASYQAIGRTVLTGVRAVASGCPVAVLPVEHFSDSGVGGSCIVVVQDQVFHRLIKPALDKHFAQRPRGGDE